VTDESELKVLFVAGLGPIVDDAASSRAFYADVVALPLEPMPHDPRNRHRESLSGVRHFALWPLPTAAESCFGTAAWPDDTPAPHA
jgi:hypothetical protein